MYMLLRNTSTYIAIRRVLFSIHNINFLSICTYKFTLVQSRIQTNTTNVKKFKKENMMNIWNLIHDNLFRVCNLHTAERDLLSLLLFAVLSQVLLYFWTCSLSLSTSRNYCWIFREPSPYTSRLRHVQIVSWIWPHMVLKFQVKNVFGWSRYQPKEDGKMHQCAAIVAKVFWSYFGWFLLATYIVAPTHIVAGVNLCR